MSAKEIGERYNVNNGTILRWLNQAGIEKRTMSEVMLNRNNGNRPSDYELKDLYEDQERSTLEIAGIYNVTPRSIILWLDNAGISRRTHSESMSLHLRKVRPSEDRLRELYEDQGMSAKKIARKFKVSEYSISKWLDEAGIQKRTLAEARLLLSGGTRPSNEELKIMYVDEEMSANQIAKKYGVSFNSISKWLDEAEIQKRTLAEALKLRNRPRYTLEEATEAYLIYSNSNNEPVDMQTFFRSYDPETLEVTEGSGPLRAHLREFNREKIEGEVQ